VKNQQSVMIVINKIVIYMYFHKNLHDARLL